MSGFTVSINFKVVPHPIEKGYFMYELHHPMHGKKYLGCFRKDTPTHWKNALRSFMLNCGYKDVPVSEVFTFHRIS